MASVNYLYRSTKDSAELIVRLLFRSHDIDYVIGAKSGIEVSKNYWTKEHKKKNPKDISVIDKQAQVNEVLNRLKSHILSRFKEANSDNIDKDWLKSQIDFFHNPPKETRRLPNELLKYFKYFIEEKKNDLALSTIKKYNVVYNLLERYEESTKKNLLLKDVDLSFKKSFEDYCFSEGYAPNTITRAIRCIKTVCNHARYNGLETSYQLEKLKTKYTKTENIYLTIEEIEKLKNIKNEKLTDKLEAARDWLVISCSTGQRVSDFMRFNKKMVRQETKVDGELFTVIEFTQKKTGREMTVPLTQDVLDILNKREGDFPPPIADQKYNLHIKEVGAIANLNEEVIGSKKLETKPNSGIFRKVTKKFKKYELISSHIGRRSFATNHYGKIPTSFLIYVTGHSTEQMFLNYIGKSNKDIALELTKYF